MSNVYIRYVTSFLSLLIKLIQKKMEEPKRRSVLDFMRSGRRLDTCRLVFCAKITVPAEEILKVYTAFAKETFPDTVSGLLLVYPDYVLHLIESSEDEIFQLCLNFQNIHPNCLGVSRCFPVQTDVRNRFFDRWYAIRVITYNLTDADTALVNVKDNFEDITKIYKETVVGLYRLYHELRMCNVTSTVRFMEKLESLKEDGHPLLPQDTALEFILNSRWGDSLQTLIDNYWNPTYPDENDDIWPFSEVTLPCVDFNEIESIKMELKKLIEASGNNGESSGST
ncbi:uncharacterized protein LOC107267838 [Cephus cinctus]|uniref:Uncharacterized protein LOC107267838 n=1 Tax=Cephus cinctus TaxID=211228 RepID=A0AAJ7BVK4_CEPCN|nr:uncharacterized protein LOC107267838 [Cephus cinctus]XP_015595475.1 uncharacterized protein LOC107267838 [Cephus cinctus]